MVSNKLIKQMAKRAGITVDEMYKKLSFQQITEQQLKGLSKNGKLLKQDDQYFENRRAKEEANRAKIREYNNNAKENRGENIKTKNFKTVKKRGQDLKVGDIYSRRIGDAVYVFKVLSNLRKSNGQFYNMDVEILNTGTDYVRQELTPNYDIKEFGKKVGDKSIDSFKNLSSPVGFNFGEVTVIEDFDQQFKKQKSTSNAKAIKGKDFDFDGEYDVVSNGVKIGKIYYDRSLKAWQNAEFYRGSARAGTVKWIYGDILGDTKQEAIDELVKRSKGITEEVPEKKEAQKEEPQKVQYTKDNILNKFLIF
jgi:hypothetical protein